MALGCLGRGAIVCEAAAIDPSICRRTPTKATRAAAIHAVPTRGQKRASVRGHPKARATELCMNSGGSTWHFCDTCFLTYTVLGGPRRQPPSALPLSQAVIFSWQAPYHLFMRVSIMYRDPIESECVPSCPPGELSFQVGGLPKTPEPQCAMSVLIRPLHPPQL